MSARIKVRPVARAATAKATATAWLRSRQWRPQPFQRETWAAIARGESGLVHASTGAGKTWAVWLGALQTLGRERKWSSTLNKGKESKTQQGQKKNQGHGKPMAPPLTVLWITPLRALAQDTLRALTEPMQDLAPHWTWGVRTGDTPARERAQQKKALPTVLITTPESLALMLSQPQAQAQLQNLRLVVVDEWHELLASKRGVQLQLCLARLRAGARTPRDVPQNQAQESVKEAVKEAVKEQPQPQADTTGAARAPWMCWGLSATLGDMDLACSALLGPWAERARVIEAQAAKTIALQTLIPERMERLTWAGHLGLSMLPQVLQQLDPVDNALLFTNTRSQAERWYQALLDARPDWAGRIGLHHGSLGTSARNWVEQALKAGELKVVVSTASLDLGVDFAPVQCVLQVGSPKSVARLVQRAGRSGHAPGQASRLVWVPTSSLDLLEAAAARQALKSDLRETPVAWEHPLDVLVQHLVTVALATGFEPEALRREVQSTQAYRNLSDDDWQWCLNFVRQGGHSLKAYPDFRRVQIDGDGLWRLQDARLARRHRINMGTIASEAMVTVQWAHRTGGRLGQLEEGFVARLKKGDVFDFGGRRLELVRVQDMTAYVRLSKAERAVAARWTGGRMSLSGLLAHEMLALLDQAQQGQFVGPEMLALKPLLSWQMQCSALPGSGQLLIEQASSSEGEHLFVYPLAGRQMHLTLGAWWAWRATQEKPQTVSVSVNDWGFELLAARGFDWAALWQRMQKESEQQTEALQAQWQQSLGDTLLVRHRFRDIARIAGLVFQSHPQEQRSQRQVQASAALYFDLFRRHEPEHGLLRQAEREVLRHELALDRFASLWRDLRRQRVRWQVLQHPSPFSFPLCVERLRERLSSESLDQRVQRMVADIERQMQIDESRTQGGTGRAPALRRRHTQQLWA